MGLKTRGCAEIVLLDMDGFLQGHTQLMDGSRQRLKFGNGAGSMATKRVSCDFESRISMRRCIEEKLAPIKLSTSLGSEALAMDDGLAELEWIRAMFTEVVVPGSAAAYVSRFRPDGSVAVVRQTDPTAEAILIIDARALYDLFHRRSETAGLCRRAQIDVELLAAFAQPLKADVDIGFPRSTCSLTV